jgi:hypothetical protein
MVYILFIFEFGAGMPWAAKAAVKNIYREPSTNRRISWPI